MKSITILRMRPGADVQQKALELFLTHGPAEGTEWTLAATNSQTYVILGDLSNPDLVAAATYAPYFDFEVIPVVDIDDTWVSAMQQAVARQA